MPPVSGRVRAKESLENGRIHVNKTVFAASVALCAALFSILGQIGAAQAQQEAPEQSFFLQVEAHSTQDIATEMIAGYLADFDNVVGYRLRSSGWHVIALGPFAERDAAAALRLDLLRSGRIPRDAFVSAGESYGVRYWPVDGVADDAATAAAQAEAARVAAEALRATQDAEARAAAEAEAERLAAEAERLAAEAARIEAERVAAERAAAEAARIEAERLEAERREAERLEAERRAAQETPAQARRAEAQLTRDDRALIQTALQWKGFYTLGIDAAFGPGTRRAMAAYQAARGYDETGVLTTAQREELLREYRDELAAIGLETWRDDQAGISIDLPMAMLEFDRYEAPFVHFRDRDGSGVQALLISQQGNLATLFGLYEIMQSLEIVPLEGARERGRNSFVLTGQSDTLRSHTFAQHANGQVKGYTLIWTPDQDARMERVVAAAQSSFESFGATLPDGIGQSPSAVTGRDLLAGLEIRRPTHSRTGFYVDGSGTIVTTAELLDSCGRLTIDEAYDAEITLRDEALGLAVLRPSQPLAPLAFANFRTDAPAPRSEIVVAGFSFEDLLTRPVLSFGELAALEGLEGQDTLRRLDVTVMPGDAGGPVFDATGSVVGMLLPRADGGTRVLPEDVNFAANGAMIHAALRGAGLRPASITRQQTLAAEELTLQAADMTVLVSCWN
jgi:peptidoglycan hydrolase-like protein with peptidoglycan-binding domain